MTAIAEAPAVAEPQQPAPNSTPPRSKFLEYVSQPARRQPTRMILFGAEGSGKTSFAAMPADRIFLMTRGEDGLKTLMCSGRLDNNIPHFPEPAQSWKQVLEAIGHLQSQDHAFKTLVIDTINGVERLCHEQVCHEHFGDDWGDSGFAGYGRGPKLAVPDITLLLARLDALRTAKGMSIILLAHAAVTTFKNPEGPDFDRYSPALHKDSWNELHRWADLICFLHRKPPTVTTSSRKAAKGKAAGPMPRVLCTERTAAYDAKNRHGLPPEIPCGNSPQEAWANFTKAMKGSRE